MSGSSPRLQPQKVLSTFELSRLTAFAFSHLFTYATQVLRAEKKEEIQNEGCRVQNTLGFWGIVWIQLNVSMAPGVHSTESLSMLLFFFSNNSLPLGRTGKISVTSN